MSIDTPAASSDLTSQRDSLRALRPVDCDLHPAAPTMKQLLPFLDEHWRESMVSRGVGDLVLAAYPPNAPISGRSDWRAGVGRPAESADVLGKQALDPWNTRVGILNCLHGCMALYADDMGAALARAVNDWLVAEWLDKEPRLRASVTVCMRDPVQAAEEIERRAADPRFVQVLLMVSGDMPLGRRAMWPVYEAAQRHGMVVGIHAGSTYHNVVTPVGWPSYYVEDYVSQSAAFQSTLLSLIGEGVFSKFHDLRVTLLESGFTWLGPFLWRADKEWRGLRTEVPWVDRAPSDIVRDHVRLTLQPVDAPPATADLADTIAHFGADDMLLFSTDYPHWQFDEHPLPAGLPSHLLPGIACDNALAFYPRLKEHRS
ncbi:MAG TPA: amidohydrolase family protein [Candidatus Sulfotelmatobacter sp.]|nr:amidohydrolase family protein [Candidatus Sulfotelmatobacter sp.]